MDFQGGFCKQIVRCDRRRQHSPTHSPLGASARFGAAGDFGQVSGGLRWQQIIRMAEWMSSRPSSRTLVTVIRLVVPGRYFGDLIRLTPCLSSLAGRQTPRSPLAGAGYCAGSEGRMSMANAVEQSTEAHGTVAGGGGLGLRVWPPHRCNFGHDSRNFCHKSRIFCHSRNFLLHLLSML